MLAGEELTGSLVHALQADGVRLVGSNRHLHGLGSLVELDVAEFRQC
jgi:hypothetical protein